MRTLTKEQVLSVAVDNNLPMPEILEGGANLNGGINSGGTKPVEWTTTGGTSPFYTGFTYRQVTCKDGTTQNQASSPNAQILDACRNNGGRAENQTNVGNAISIGQAPKQQEQISDLQYYTSANFLKRASVSIVPVGLIGAYCYNKKFSLVKSALLVSIPIVVITGLQYVFMGGGKNAYWGIFVPPSVRANSMKQIQLMPKPV